MSPQKFLSATRERATFLGLDKVMKVIPMLGLRNFIANCLLLFFLFKFFILLKVSLVLHLTEHRQPFKLLLLPFGIVAIYFARGIQPTKIYIYLAEMEMDRNQKLCVEMPLTVGMKRSKCGAATFFMTPAASFASWRVH